MVASGRRIVRSPIAQRGPRRLQRQPTASSAPGAAPDTEAGPWSFLFQCNERYLQWDDSATRQLIKLHVARKLDKDVVWVDGKLDELAVLLPDMVGKLERMRADLVLQLVADTDGVARKLVALRSVVPTANLSDMFSRNPSLLLEITVEQVQVQVDALRAALPGVDVEKLLDREPLLLRADIRAVLDDIRRILPNADPVAVLLKDPTIVLDMQTAGMPSAEGESLL